MHIKNFRYCSYIIHLYTFTWWKRECVYGRESTEFTFYILQFKYIILYCILCHSRCVLKVEKMSNLQQSYGRS